jgi:hypothetical protein
MRRALILIAAAMALVCGCAATNSHAVSAKAAKTLESYLQNVRTAANGTSTPDLQTAVQRFDSEVESLSRSGEITPQRAQKIENQALALLADYKQHNKPTPPATPSETPTPSPSITPTTPGPVVTVTVPPTTPPTTPPVPPTGKPSSSPSNSPIL